MSGGKRRGEGRLSVVEIWDDTEVSVGRGRETEGKGVEGEGRGRYHTEVNGGRRDHKCNWCLINPHVICMSFHLPHLSLLSSRLIPHPPPPSLISSSSSSDARYGTGAASSPATR